MLRTLYLIRSTSPDSEVFYKIGYTKQVVSARVKQLQTGNPNKLEVICTYQSIYTTGIEAIMHRTYNQSHVHLEWFRLDDEQVAHFLVNCVKFEKNLQILSTNTYYNKFYIPSELQDVVIEDGANSAKEVDDDDLWYM